MDSNELKSRTQSFAVRVINMVRSLPRDVVGREIGKQILRSGTSVAANYRSACRAKSTADFIYKIKISEEEADETQFWLEIIISAELLPVHRVKSLYKEVSEITAILTSSGKTSRTNKQIKNKL